MKDIHIQILIVTHNDVNLIDKTVESIKKQNFLQENIYLYLVDFGSTDGTYEKILQYERKRTAIFQCGDIKDERIMVAEAAKLTQYEGAGGAYCYGVLLHPGDIIYPDFLAICSAKMLKNVEFNPALLVCEADIISKTGNIIQQKSIFEEERLLNGLQYREQMLGQGYKHYVGYFGGGLSGSYHRVAGKQNERIFWNNVLYACGFESNFIYIPERLIALREKEYFDEIEEILLRWENNITYLRTVQGKINVDLECHVEHKIKENIAEYCLWRAVKRYDDLSQKDLEDMLYLAEIIDTDIINKSIYSKVHNLIFEKDKSQWDLCKNYFGEER